MTATPVFQNVGGTDYLLQVPGWSVQGTSVNPGPGTRVFAHTPEHTDTPASVAGWTVQQSGMYAL